MVYQRIINFKKQWLQWHNTQRKLIVQAMLMLHISPIVMRIIGVQQWLSILRFLTPINCQRRIVTATELEQIHWLNIQAVNHSLMRGKCLTRSINLWWLMRRHQIETELRIGIRNKSNQFKAHAWLEYQGRPINFNQTMRQRFRTFDKLKLDKGWQSS